jgi:hypothetical protein
MSITVDAVYENGVLKPIRSLPLNEHEKVRLTIECRWSASELPADGALAADPALIEWAATDPDLAYPEPRDVP